MSVRLVFPGGLTQTQARRLSDIADALEPLGAEALIDASLFELNEPRCDCCGRGLEGGWCYACKPVSGYGEGFRCETCADRAEFERAKRRAGL